MTCHAWDPYDRSAPSTPSQPACGVCGSHALARNSPCEDPAGAPADRLFCLVCGAHHHLAR